MPRWGISSPDEFLVKPQNVAGCRVLQLFCFVRSLIIPRFWSRISLFIGISLHYLPENFKQDCLSIYGGPPANVCI